VSLLGHEGCLVAADVNNTQGFAVPGDNAVGSDIDSVGPTTIGIVRSRGNEIRLPHRFIPNRLMSTEDVNKTVETMVSTRITTLVRCVVCDT